MYAVSPPPILAANPSRDREGAVFSTMIFFASFAPLRETSFLSQLLRECSSPHLVTL
jgi:hypothetical protein